MGLFGPPFEVAMDYLEVELLWSNAVDLDLEIFDPENNHIRSSNDEEDREWSGAEHSGDQRAGGSETIRWRDGAMAGEYDVFVRNFSSSEQPYQIEVRGDGAISTVSGTAPGGTSIKATTFQVDDSGISMAGSNGGGNGGSGGGGGGLTSSAGCSAYWRPVLVGSGPNWKLSRLVWDGDEHYAPRDYAQRNFLRFRSDSSNRWTYEVMTGNVNQYNADSEYSISYDPSYVSGVPCVLNYRNQLGSLSKFALASYSGGQLRMQWSNGQGGVSWDWYWVRS